jgi:hypothetical protein
MIRWRPHLPKNRDERWYLMTYLEFRAEALCQLYACRMSVEEVIRDHKNRRNGWSLRNTGIQHTESL